MSDQQKRRSPRYRVAVPVTFLDSKSGQSEHRTVDVSRGGVFVQSEMPRAIRQLVRLKLEVPPVGAPVEVHGMVVHVITPDEASANGTTPGMGIEFFGFGGDPRQIWEDFLRSVQSGAVQAYQSAAPPVQAPPEPEPDGLIDDSLPPVGAESFSTTPAPFASAAVPQAYQPPPASYGPPPQGRPPRPSPAGGVQPQRQLPSARASTVCRVFPVPMPVVDSLYELHDNEMVTGAMFLCTPVQVPVGDRVVLRVIHPNSQESFDLHGIVQSVSVDPRYPGLTLALRPSTLARREKFMEFINRGLPEEDLSYDLVDE